MICRVGEPFKPIDLRSATAGRLHPPAIVGRQRDLKDGPKRLYQALYSRATTNPDGICWPGFDTLAADLGKSEKSVRSDMKVLETAGLIRHQWRSGRKSNTYEFLWSRLFERNTSTGQKSALGNRSPEFERKPATVQSADQKRNSEQCGDFERQNHADLTGTRVPTNSLSDLFKGNSSSSVDDEVATPVVAAVAVGADDDDSAPHKLENRVREALFEFLNTEGFPMPSGFVPDEQIAQDLQRVGGNLEDLSDFLQTYRDRLTNGPPAHWSHVATAFRRWTSDPRALAAIGLRIDWTIASERGAMNRQTAAAAEIQTSHAESQFVGADSRTKGSLQARLIAVCRSRSRPRTASLLEAATITDDGRRLEIDLPRTSLEELKLEVVRAGLESLGEEREIVLQHSTDRKPAEVANVAG